MSRIRIEHGRAEVRLDGIEMPQVSGSTNVNYAPLDLMDATAGALLAVNTPQSVTWAHEIFRMTASTQ